MKYPMPPHLSTYSTLVTIHVELLWEYGHSQPPSLFLCIVSFTSLFGLLYSFSWPSRDRDRPLHGVSIYDVRKIRPLSLPLLPRCPFHTTYYRGARLIVHWLIDQFWLIDQISTEPIGVSSNKFIWLIDQFWSIDQSLAIKIAYQLSAAPL